MTDRRQSDLPPLPCDIAVCFGAEAIVVLALLMALIFAAGPIAEALAALAS
jgi:hypothetical protein